MPRTKKASSGTQKPFPLLKLPSEIRNHIWRYVVVKTGKVYVRKQVQDGHLRSPQSITTKPVNQGTDWQRQKSRPAVAFTCRQIYLEVTPIYYSANIFWNYGDWDDHRKFVNFTAAIGPDNASMITELNLYEFGTPVNQYLTMLPGLKRLHSRNHGEVGWQNRLTALAQKHASLDILYEGELWGPDKWILYPGEE